MHYLLHLLQITVNLLCCVSAGIYLGPCAHTYLLDFCPYFFILSHPASLLRCSNQYLIRALALLVNVRSPAMAMSALVQLVRSAIGVMSALDMHACMHACDEVRAARMRWGQEVTYLQEVVLSFPVQLAWTIHAAAAANCKQTRLCVWQSLISPYNSLRVATSKSVRFVFLLCAPVWPVIDLPCDAITHSGIFRVFFFLFWKVLSFSFLFFGCLGLFFGGSNLTSASLYTCNIHTWMCVTLLLSVSIWGVTVMSRIHSSSPSGYVTWCPLSLLCLSIVPSHKPSIP